MRIVLWDERCPSANEVMYNTKHWRVRAKEAERIHAAVAFWSITRNIGEEAIPEWNYPVKVTVTAYLTGRLIDCSNVPVKLYEDGLKLAGVIQDDSPKYVSAVEARVVKAIDGRNSVVIDIEEMSERPCPACGRTVTFTVPNVGL